MHFGWPHWVADAEMKQRFDREAQTIASLKHPNICVLHDIGQQDGIDFGQGREALHEGPRVAGDPEQRLVVVAADRNLEAVDGNDFHHAAAGGYGDQGMPLLGTP